MDHTVGWEAGMQLGNLFPLFQGITLLYLVILQIANLQYIDFPTNISILFQ